MKRYLMILLTLFSLFSCGLEEQKDEEEQALIDARNQQFFDIVYIAQGYREIGSPTWRPVSGEKKMKFCASSDPTCTQDLGLDFDDEEENSIDEGDSDGFFSFFHIRYQETQFQEPCSGGYIGYYIDSENFTEPDGTEDDEGWNVFDPYDGESSGGSEEVTDDDEEVAEVFSTTFYTRIIPEQINLDEACSSPEFNSSYTILRFSSGEVVASDNGRGIQYLFKPLLNN